MAKFLVTEFEYFVDPHGSPDQGAVKKFITEDKRYLEYVHEDDDMYYRGDGEFVHEDDLRGSEDGYNCVTHQYYVEEISNEQAETYQRIINAYNAL